jgi:imidazole glycerol-phosphate synthase subunit HisH
MITIIDYGMGNLRSVEKACEFLGYEAMVSDKASDIENATKLILPGVGAFGDAMKNLEDKGLVAPIKAAVLKGVPFLGICLGMQLIFDKSYEHGQTDGLSLIRGEVVPFTHTHLKVPHMGWNNLLARQNELFDKSDDQYVYFVHSFYVSGVADENIIAKCQYGNAFVAAVNKDNVYGLQFHPEKSGEIGLNMLKRFAKLK